MKRPTELETSLRISFALREIQEALIAYRDQEAIPTLEEMRRIAKAGFSVYAKSRRIAEKIRKEAHEAWIRNHGKRSTSSRG